MEHAEPAAYGLWSLVVINSLVLIIFAFSFAKPQTTRDWRSFGAFSAFLAALFTEMYGFPLTIYLLSGWLVNRFPGVDFLAHDSGHLLEVMFGWRANPHFGVFHLASTLFIFGGLAGQNTFQSFVIQRSRDDRLPEPEVADLSRLEQRLEVAVREVVDVRRAHHKLLQGDDHQKGDQKIPDRKLLLGLHGPHRS